MDWFNPFEGSEGGGGGSGTDNYNELINKPSINNVVLSGNKTEDDLGLQKKISSNNKISSDNVSDLGAQNLFTNATEKQAWNAKQDAIQNLQDIQSGAAAGETAVQTISINGIQQTKDNGNIDLPAYPTTLPASDTTNLYDPTGTSPISGKGVAAAIGTLDVAAVGGAGKYISEISETNGKLSATPTTMDTSLSNSSTNNNCPTSKTVYDDQQRQDAALAEVENKGAKNLAPNTAKSETVSTVSFTVNSDGTVLANGTASTAAWFMTAENLTLQPGTYVISGGQEASGTVNVRVVFSTSKTAADIIADSNGESTEFTITSATTANVYVRMSTGRTANNVTVCPMICTKAEWDISQSYVPYGKTNAELTAEKTNQQSEINYAVNVGAKNLLKNTRTTTTHKDITFTVNEDGSVTASGTNDGTGASVLDINTQTSLALSNGDYILTGCPAGGSDSGYMMDITRSPGSSIKDTGSGAAFTVGGDYTVTEFRIVISRNVTVNNLTFYPMIRPASITDSTFVPYAKTNRELTVENDSQQSEINYAVNTGVKNLFDINTSLPLKIYHTTYTLSDGSLTVTSNGSWGHHSVPVNLPAGNYIFTATISNFSKDSSASATSVRMRVTDTTATGGIEIASKAVTGNGAFELPFTWTGGQCYIQYYPNYTSTTTYVSSFTASNNMIRPAYIIDPTYEPYALSNPVLTPAVIKTVDEGAKNLLHFDQLGYSTVQGMSMVHRGVTFTLTDDTVVCSGTNDNTDNSHCRLYIGSDRVYVTDLCDGNHILSGTPSAGGAGKWSMSAYYGVSGVTQYNRSDYGEGVLLTEPSESGYNILIDISISKGQNASGLIFKPMICTASDWAVSKKFVPYCQTNRELYETKATVDDIYGVGTVIPDNSDLNNYKTPGSYYVGTSASAATIVNIPLGGSGFRLIVRNTSAGNRYRQEFIKPNNPETLYVRHFTTSETWSPWYKFEGTVMA